MAEYKVQKTDAEWRAQLNDLGLRFTRDVPERTRAFAAYGLGLIGRSAGEATRVAIVDALTQTLANPDADLRRRDVAVAGGIDVLDIRMVLVDGEVVRGGLGQADGAAEGGGERGVAARVVAARRGAVRKLDPYGG